MMGVSRPPTSLMPSAVRDGDVRRDVPRSPEDLQEKCPGSTRQRRTKLLPPGPRILPCWSLSPTGHSPLPGTLPYWAPSPTAALPCVCKSCLWTCHVHWVFSGAETLPPGRQESPSPVQGPDYSPQLSPRLSCECVNEAENSSCAWGLKRVLKGRGAVAAILEQVRSGNCSVYTRWTVAQLLHPPLWPLLHLLLFLLLPFVPSVAFSD